METEMGREVMFNVPTLNYDKEAPFTEWQILEHGEHCDVCDKSRTLSFLGMEVAKRPEYPTEEFL